MAVVSPEAKARKAEYMKAWRKANRERLREYMRDWVTENHERNAVKARVRNLRYYHANRDKTVDGRREQYAEMTPEERRRRAGYKLKGRKVMTKEELRAKRREYELKYRQENPAAAAARLAQRRAKLAKATVSWADREAIKAIYAKAKELEKQDGLPRNVDHIVPLRGKNASGLHVPHNLQILLAIDNQRKGAAYDDWA